MEYFKHRSEQLLVFNITAGEGWTKHCPFLHEQVPAISFPCANTVAEREKLLRRRGFARGGCIAILGGMSSS